MLGACCAAYGDGVLRGNAGAVSDALGRLLRDGAYDLSLLARLVVGAQALTSLGAGLFGSVLERLQQPGVREGVEARLAAAQADVPPARRLAYEQLLVLFATTATLQDQDKPPTPANSAARRCGGTAAGLAVARSVRQVQSHH
jgi:hypothetical protein